MTTAPATPKVRPSAWWYALVPVVFLAGVAIAVLAAIDEGRTIADSFSRVGDDGRASIELAAGEEATVFALWSDGRSSDSVTRPPATIAVTGPDGDDVTFRPAGGGTTTFDTGGDAGIDLGTFTARDDGTHQLEVEFDVPAGTPRSEAAVGRLDISAVVGRVIRPIALAALASLGLFVLLLVLRGASKRRIRRGPQFPGTQFGPPSPPGGSQGPITFS